VEIVLAAAAAGLWGLGDFFGGRATRSLSPVAVTFAGQLVSLLPIGVLMVVMGVPSPSGRDWMWGTLAGLLGFVGMVLLYYALGNGAMTVVAPLTGVLSATVPLAAGIALGERPSTLSLAGVALALLGITLVTGAIGKPHRPTPPVVIAAAITCGVLIGLSLVCLDRASDGSGLWPVFTMRSTSVALGAIAVAVLRPEGLSLRNPPRHAMLAGTFDITANMLFLWATRTGLLSLVSVIASLYPASTITLAMKFDRERITRSQALGMLAVGVALVLVTLGR
jgi:drug/metabolite transporter (DMT)-like permease